ncbi:hypothetical protein SO802_026779 [Lithocarpus litseifolius]|uniref:Late embryogenesis abundant protein LEA-2 subgroup domain-containing protein n=1 Tax=Lithocarpus litseifolius TaxID=425828 RepID=A0AAW2C0R0_9ROSI
MNDRVYPSSEPITTNNNTTTLIPTTTTLATLALLLAIAGFALYVLYHPQKPHFSITSLCIAKLNLTVATLNSSPSASHLNLLFNLTLTSKNPNSHIVFFYDLFTFTAFFHRLRTTR